MSGPQRVACRPLWGLRLTTPGPELRIGGDDLDPSADAVVASVVWGIRDRPFGDG